MNFTVLAPEGTINHGNPSLICTPPSWKDYLTFLSTNFLIHALTLPAHPGESTSETVFGVLNAFFIPIFGVTRALRRIMLRPALTRHNDIGQAVAAGALVMVLNEHERMEWADEGHMEHVRCPSGRQVYGRCILPTGYGLYIVPLGCRLKPYSRADSLSIPAPHIPAPQLGDVEVELASSEKILPPPSSREIQTIDDSVPERQTTNLKEAPLRSQNMLSTAVHNEITLCKDYSIAKAFFSIFQIVSEILTLYQARGDQLNRFGYGAFSLSVVPYTFMSLTNFAATLLSPTYPTMYLVYTPDLNQAELEGGSFDGIVAEIDLTRVHSGPRFFRSWIVRFSIINLLAYILSIVVPLAIVGGLSSFRTGSITVAQRAWIMAWLVSGYISGICVSFLTGSSSSGILRWVYSILIMPFWIPAIGGFVVVVQEMAEYGSCIKIDS